MEAALASADAHSIALPLKIAATLFMTVLTAAASPPREWGCAI